MMPPPSLRCSRFSIRHQIENPASAGRRIVPFPALWKEESFWGFEMHSPPLEVMPGQSPPVVNALGVASKWLSIVVVGISLIVLVGWALDIGVLKSLIPGRVTQKPNTAIGLMASGAALLLWRWQMKFQARRPQPMAKRRFPFAVFLLAVFAIALGLVNLLEYGLGLNFGIDQLLFETSPDAVDTLAGGRSAPNTAVNFVLIGSALLLLMRQQYRAAQGFSAAAFAVALLALTGHLYAVADFYRVGSVTGMAVHTAIAFLLLALSVLFASADRGWMREFTSDYAGSVMLRRMLPLMGVLPPLLGSVILLIYENLALLPEGAFALRSIFGTLLFSAVIWWNGRSLNRLDAQRQAMLRQFSQELESQVAARTAELEVVNRELRQEITERVQAEVSLRESENQMRRAINFAPFPIIVHAEGGEILAVSQTLTNMTGYTAAEISTIPDWTQRAYGERQSIVQEVIDQLYQVDGPIDEGEFAVRTQDGGTLIWDFSSAPLGYTVDGRRLVISMAADVTARKRVEADLQESRLALQRQLAEIEAIYQTAPIGLNVLDPDLRFVRINERLAEMNGFSVEEHIGRTVGELLPDLAEPAERLLRPVLETGEPLLNVEIHGETPAQPGVPRVWLESFLPLKDGDRVIGINTVCEEITEQRRMAAALHQSESRYRTLFETMEDGFCVVEVLFDEAGQPFDYLFIEVNPAFERQTGLYQAAGKTALELVPGLEPHWAEIYGNVVRTGESVRFENSGESMGRWFEVSAFPVAAQGRNRVAILFRNVTERKQADLALREAQIQLESALAAGSIYTWRWNISSNLVVVNQSFSQLFGVNSNEAAVGLPIEHFIDAMHPDDRPQVTRAIQRAIATGEDYQAEYRIHDASGEEHWVLARGQAEYDAAGHAIAFPGALADITNRKKAEAGLREYSARLDFILAASQLGTWEVDLQVQPFVAEPRSLRHDQIYGYDSLHPNWTYDTFLSHIHPGDRPQVAERFAATLATLNDWEVECRIIRADGALRWVWISGSVYQDPNLQSKRLIGLIADISDRKQAETALMERALQQAAVANIGQQALAVKDLDTFLQAVTAHMAQVLDVEYCKVLELLPEGDRLLLRAGVGWHDGLIGNATVESDRASQAGYTLASHDQVVVDDLRTETRFSGPALLTDHAVTSGMSTTISSTNGHPFGVLGIHTRAHRVFTQDDVDFLQAIANILAETITRHQTEQEIRQLNVSLERRVEARTRQLTEVNQELEAFAYSVSHDLRAPLRAIEGFARIFQEDYGDRLDTTGQEYTQMLIDSASQMDALIRDLLAYSQMGRREIQRVPVSLEVLVQRAFQGLDAEMRDRQPQVIVEPLPVVLGQRSVLQQVIGNLITNAIKFVEPDKTPVVKIWAEERQPFVRIWIEDNGIGISPNHQRRIFRPFERLHGIEAYPGTGIGLAIVQRGVERLGGQVGVESVPGAGSRFWIELPRS